MDDVLLASGRVSYLPMSDFGPGGCVTWLVTGTRRRATACRKVVDATCGEADVPSTHFRHFDVTDGVRCIPVNALARGALPARHVA